MNMKVDLNTAEVNALCSKLDALNRFRMDAVEKKELTQIYNRGKASGGTPVSTEATRPGGPHGELRQSLTISEHEVGYTKDYAPHVEYGHRTRNGGYVPGQRYLQQNVETQRPIFIQDLLNAIEKEGG